MAARPGRAATVLRIRPSRRSVCSTASRYSWPMNSWACPARSGRERCTKVNSLGERRSSAVSLATSRVLFPSIVKRSILARPSLRPARIRAAVGVPGALVKVELDLGWRTGRWSRHCHEPRRTRWRHSARRLMDGSAVVDVVGIPVPAMLAVHPPAGEHRGVVGQGPRLLANGAGVQGIGAFTHQTVKRGGARPPELWMARGLRPSMEIAITRSTALSAASSLGAVGQLFSRQRGRPATVRVRPVRERSRLEGGVARHPAARKQPRSRWPATTSARVERSWA